MTNSFPLHGFLYLGEFDGSVYRTAVLSRYLASAFLCMAYRPLLGIYSAVLFELTAAHPENVGDALLWLC